MSISYMNDVCGVGSSKNEWLDFMSFLNMYNIKLWRLDQVSKFDGTHSNLLIYLKKICNYTLYIYILLMFARMCLILWIFCKYLFLLIILLNDHKFFSIFI